MWVRHSHGHEGRGLLRDGARPGEPGVHPPEGTAGCTRAEGMLRELWEAREGSWEGMFSEGAGHTDLHLSPGCHLHGDKVLEGREGPPRRTTGLCSPRAGTCVPQPDQSQRDRLQTSRRRAGRSRDPQVRHWLSPAQQTLKARPGVERLK